MRRRSPVASSRKRFISSTVWIFNFGTLFLGMIINKSRILFGDCGLYVFFGLIYSLFVRGLRLCFSGVQKPPVVSTSVSVITDTGPPSPSLLECAEPEHEVSGENGLRPAGE